MDSHVRIAGWLWIANGVLTILMGICGLTIANLNIPNPQDSLLVTAGSSVCCFLPLIIAYFVAGWGLLQHKSWARILAIILAILSLCSFPVGTILGGIVLYFMFQEETTRAFS